MLDHHRPWSLVATAGLLLGFAQLAVAADWITAPSYYTHSPTAQRVAQYQPVGPYYYFERPDYVRSGYRHTRSSVQIGNSADNLHIVEEWGRPVRPYDEWRFPYRPYSVPYPAWGPQYGPLGGYGGYGGIGGGFGGGYPPNQNPYGVQVPPGNGYIPQQTQDGYWPSYDRHDRSDYFRPYRN
jgi:hypothetical protein